ncbi:MAG: indole-3-glycerol phosphate synthase TrpC [Clostridia bacterium]
MNTTILETIAAATKARVEKAKQEKSLETIKSEAQRLDANTGFPFEQALRSEDIAFICECKKASPSKGLIAQDFPYLKIAGEYEEAGAAAISVLTEPQWFLGSNEILQEIASAVKIPCLRKDFTVDEYMIYEAKTLGASAVLLICALLKEDTMRDYIKICDRLGLSALVEAHDEREIQSAVRAGARIIGVNNRNLHDFTVDVHNSERLRKLVPETVLFVAESGIRSAADIRVLRNARVNGVLIGETLMRAPDKRAMLCELRGGTAGENQDMRLAQACDIEYVNELLPDYIGFIFAEKAGGMYPAEAAKLNSWTRTGGRSLCRCHG